MRSPRCGWRSPIPASVRSAAASVMGRAPPRSALSGLLVRVLAAERLGLAALGRAGADVLHRLPVVAVVAGLALAGAGVAGGLVGAVVLAGGRDAVALDARGGLGRGGGLGHRDRAGERAGDGQQGGLVHRRPHLIPGSRPSGNAPGRARGGTAGDYSRDGSAPSHVAGRDRSRGGVSHRLAVTATAGAGAGFCRPHRSALVPRRLYYLYEV